MLYVLTRDYQILTRGGTPDYGISSQLIGVFSESEKAEKAKLNFQSTDEYKNTHHLDFDVAIVNVDNMYAHMLTSYYV